LECGVSTPLSLGGGVATAKERKQKKAAKHPFLECGVSTPLSFFGGDTVPQRKRR
jgi:hypothetical protein